jgi:hypothetical protein
MPPNDVQRFYQDCVEGGAHVPASSYVTSSDLNEAYILWCGREDREPLPLPNFTKDFDKLKVQKQGGNNAIGGGVKYFAIALRPEVAREVEESKKLKKLEKKAARKRKALQATEAALAEPRRAADDADIAAERLRAAAGAMRDTLAKPDAPADKPAKAA